METEKRYAMKSISGEGIWYLVNGWRKNKAFWKSEISEKTLFKSRQSVQSSLAKLLKTMPEYKADKFEIVEVEI